MAIEIPRIFKRPAMRMVDFARKTDSLKLLPELLESQWWNLAMLEELQAKRMAELGRYVRANVPYWAAAFAKAGFDDDEDLTTENITRLPLLNKDMIREAGDSLKSREFDKWQPRHKNTSGSTGVPLDYYIDRPAHSWQWAHMWRGWAQTGYVPGDLYASISGGSLIPEKAALKQTIYMALSSGLHFPTYHMNDEIMERYATRLARSPINFVYGYPSSLEIFSEYITASPRKKLPMKAVFTTSEGLSPKARAAIELAFDCPVYDTYGCNDGGIFSFECEHHNGLHMGMETDFVEIVDEEGNRVPDGEPGEVIATNLVIRAMPLLRFRTGDIANLTREPCECGRGLIRVQELSGRERDVIHTPDGRKIHGAFFTHFEALHHADWIARFQIHQPDVKTFILRVILRREPSEEDKQAVIKDLRTALGDMDFRIDVVEEMEVTRTGKFRIIVSDLS